MRAVAFGATLKSCKLIVNLGVKREYIYFLLGVHD